MPGFSVMKRTDMIAHLLTGKKIDFELLDRMESKRPTPRHAKLHGVTIDVDLGINIHWLYIHWISPNASIEKHNSHVLIQNINIEYNEVVEDEINPHALNGLFTLTLDPDGVIHSVAEVV